MNRHLVRLCLALAAIAAGAPAHAAAIVDTAHVVDAVKRGAIVWDVRGEGDYRRGHIPGAVNVGEVGRVLRDENSEDFIATDKVAQILGAAGIDPAREVIVYATRGSSSAYFGRYALQYFGARQVSVYHDGIEGWVEARQGLATDVERRPALALALTPQPGMAIETAEVVSRVTGRADVQIIDARSPREFAGEDIRAIRGGHIPGAVNIPYEANWKDPATPQKLARRQVADSRGMSLKDRDELKALYAKLDPGKETIVYCQSGVRAAETAAVLEDLGFGKVRLYDSSWLGYAARFEAPAGNETFVNVGLLKGQINLLMRRVEELERDLTEVRAAAVAGGRCPGGAARC